ncbi:uncharacterized protein METZ01_LOCUS441209, partial [marine metagenome]
MASFAANGYLRFDNLVPKVLNEAAEKEMASHEVPREQAG